MRIKNAVENVDWIFLKMAEQSYFVKIVLIIHNKRSQADIAHNSLNRSNNEQPTRTNIGEILLGGYLFLYIIFIIVLNY